MLLHAVHRYDALLFLPGTRLQDCRVRARRQCHQDRRLEGSAGANPLAWICAAFDAHQSSLTAMTAGREEERTSGASGLSQRIGDAVVHQRGPMPTMANRQAVALENEATDHHIVAREARARA